MVMMMEQIKGLKEATLVVLLGPVDPSFRAFSGRLKFTVRRHKFKKDCLSGADQGAERGDSGGAPPHGGPDIHR